MVKASGVKSISIWQAIGLAIRYAHHAPGAVLAGVGTLLLTALARPVLLGLAGALLLIPAASLYLEAPLQVAGFLTLLPLFGAVTVGAVTNWGGGATLGNLRTCLVEATADADVTTGNIAHGLPFTPNFGLPIPILPQGALKAWSWDRTNTGAVNTLFVGNNVVGSGVAGNQLMCIFGRLNTLIH